ncbi:MAG: bifunctional alpha,alpha-trehalose-phosphate synthase (UDP-forming)/trehalose-phosphatase [Bdellovibrionaceae bacterium]|nr:bifunctional alpha,alpha-trehalose-phosphate synthase (UDP-forming)/trehalose-phosphatase [Pseudobdellovibrionaceae bacterium]
MSRWIMVSNRLPFKLLPNGQFAPSSGGLVTAIGGIRSKAKVERIWIGGAPEGLTEEAWRKRRPTSGKSAWQHVPIFINEDLYDSYYNGFCNDVLWPLLHYQNDLIKFSDQVWNAYIQVNDHFAREIASMAKADDLIWVHDYHLFLLPQLLKRLRPDLRIGFFLHVPFPSSEVFRQLPSREAILESLLTADLVGFHDYSYLHHFCSSLSRILGLESTLLSVRHRGHITRLGVFPVSIDTQAIQARARSAEVDELSYRYRKPCFFFLGVDRLDYIKGLDLKLLAFKTLLARYPEVHGKCSLLQLAIPTRTGTPEFSRLHQEFSRMVGEINGLFSTPSWTPIHYMHTSVNGDELLSLYRAADALLVTSKRDGMNLVALEYIAAQTSEHPGVVVLSEFTGALSILSHTLPINPWNTDDTADKMKLAMEMPKQEKSYRLASMTRYLERYTATDWAQTFLDDLAKTPLAAVGVPHIFQPTRPAVDALAAEIAKKAHHVSLILDYDGTLVPIEESPELAVLPPATREILRDFTRFPWLDVLIISGREKRFLQAQFEGVPVALGAEHGAIYFDPQKKKWTQRVQRARSGWYPVAVKILTDYTLRVPRSQIEKKHFALSWHYRQSPSEYADYMAKKIAEELQVGLANLPVTIIRGKKVVEVRAAEADKGLLATWYLEHQVPGSFPLAFGDDRTDEDMFLALKNRGYSFRIGVTDTGADHVLESQASVLPFLSALLASLNQRMRSNRSREAQQRTLTSEIAAP